MPRTLARQRASERLLYTRSGAAVKRMALEFDALASDVYWIRAIQHYGGDRLARDGRREYELLQPLLDLTTTLDPFFTIAYRFGAIFLSEAPPGGPGRPDQAIALLEKGIAAQPEKWQYFHDIAFVHYWHLHDPVTAANWFQRAAAQPDAPNWLRPLAATMVSARDRSAARMLWQQILESDQPWMRRTAQRSLIAARRRSIRSTSCRRSFSRPVCLPGRRMTWTDLVRSGILPGVPVDPDRRALPARSRHRPRHHLASLQPQPDARSPPSVAMSIDTLVLVCLVLLGLAVGSFLNVCIHRLPSRSSVVSPGSRCPSCGYALGWADNIPVVSYVMLRGRCRSCKAPISLRYPIVELLTMACVRAALPCVRRRPDPRSAAGVRVRA